MRLSEFLQDVGRPIAYYPALSRITGGVGPTLFLCQFLYWLDKGHAEDGSIYKSQEDITNETGLSRREQESSRRALRERGLLYERYARLDHRMYYRVDLDRLNELWDAAFANGAKRHSAMAENAIGQSPEQPLDPLTQTTTEITSETTPERAPAPWAPQYYRTLCEVPGFTRSLEHCQAWLAAQPARVRDRAEETAYAVKAKWPPSRKHKDPWATFQQWAKMKPLRRPGEDATWESWAEYGHEKQLEEEERHDWENERRRLDGLPSLEEEWEEAERNYVPRPPPEGPVEEIRRRQREAREREHAGAIDVAVHDPPGVLP